MDVSKKLLPDVWTYFVQNTISTHQQTVDNNKLKKLFEELKLNFCKSLNGAKWIDENTKVAIVKKCNNLNLVTFTPLDSASLAKNYQELNVTDDYPTNLINLLENYKRMVYSTAGTPISANTMWVEVVWNFSTVWFLQIFLLLRPFGCQTFNILRQPHDW